MKNLITIAILTVCACLPAFSQNTEYSRGGKDGVWFEVRNDTACEVITPMGTLSCVKVEAMAKSRIGKTHLTAYYNDTYGFVKMDNTNIDGSKIIINLRETNF
ncbi:MAG: hypothetical protein IKP54_02285 [Bacteroidales bacterium]|nr:hypothetical protein [Bacteroidales bacterium]